MKKHEEASEAQGRTAQALMKAMEWTVVEHPCSIALQLRACRSYSEACIMTHEGMRWGGCVEW